MPSKNRITINFKNKKLFEFIQENAKSNKSSASMYAEKMLNAEYRRCITKCDTHDNNAKQNSTIIESPSLYDMFSSTMKFAVINSNDSQKNFEKRKTIIEIHNSFSIIASDKHNNLPLKNSQIYLLPLISTPLINHIKEHWISRWTGSDADFFVILINKADVKVTDASTKEKNKESTIKYETVPTIESELKLNIHFHAQVHAIYKNNHLLNIGYEFKKFEILHLDKKELIGELKKTNHNELLCISETYNGGYFIRKTKNNISFECRDNIKDPTYNVKFCLERCNVTLTNKSKIKINSTPDNIKWRDYYR